MEKQYGLLIGNGLNRCFCKKTALENDPLSWKNVLKFAVEYANDKGANIEISDMDNLGPTFQFEYIANSIDSGVTKYTELKKSITSYISKYINNLPDEMVQLIHRTKSSFIITTNYDNNLEVSLLGHPYTFSSVRNSESHYTFEKTNLGMFKNSLDENVLYDMYHIHGTASRPKYICLGFEHYNRITSIISIDIGTEQNNQDVIENDNMPRIIKFLKGSMSKTERDEMAQKVYTRFFDSDIDIVGLELSADEIDIWYILCYRAYLYFSDESKAKTYIQNTITYYDTCSFSAILTTCVPDSSKLDSMTDQQKCYAVQQFLNQKKKTYEKMHINYVPQICDNMGYEKAYSSIFEKIGTNRNSSITE